MSFFSVSLVFRWLSCILFFLQVFNEYFNFLVCDSAEFSDENIHIILFCNNPVNTGLAAVEEENGVVGVGNVFFCIFKINAVYFKCFCIRFKMRKRIVKSYENHVIIEYQKKGDWIYEKEWKYHNTRCGCCKADEAEEETVYDAEYKVEDEDNNN